MPTELYLVRHGESVANVEPIIAGMRGDVGLTDRGREQARLLERRLHAEGLRADWLYASTLPRAWETAQYVARALQLPIQPDDELHELRPGDADGLTVDQWRERYGGGGGVVDRPGRRDPFHAFSPGGEPWAAFLVRAGAALTALVDRHPDETVVAVCHAGVVEVSFFLAFGLGGTANRVAFATLNTSITRWRHYRSHPGGRRDWTVVTFDDAAHLTDTPALHETARAPGSSGVGGGQSGVRTAWMTWRRRAARSVSRFGPSAIGSMSVIKWARTAAPWGRSRVIVSAESRSRSQEAVVPRGTRPIWAQRIPSPLWWNSAPSCSAAPSSV